MATKEQLLAAGFTEDEILSEAGFAPQEIGSSIQTNPPTFTEGLTEGGLLGFAGKVAAAPFKAAYGLGELAVNSAKTYADNPNYQQLPMGTGIFPAITENIVGGADTPLMDKLGNAGRFATGFLPGLTTGIDALTTDKSGYELGKQLNEELSYAPMSLAVPAYKAGRGVYTGIRDKFGGGLPAREALVRAAGRPDIYANKLDYARSKVKGENVQIQAAANTSEAFANANPVAGIDNTLPGEQQIAQLQSNLKNIESTAIRTRAEILPKVAEAQEAAAANGISTTIKFEDIPKSFKTDAGELGLDTLRQKYGDTPVDLADDFMRKEFGMVPEYIGPAYEGAPMQMAPSRALSVEDANFLRQKIDGQVQALGGYDTSYWANKGLDPSVADGYAEALGFYRKQLDGVVKGKIRSVLGDSVAEAFTKAGENISMTKTYSPMVQRFATATGEAFTPGSAKSAPPGQGSFLGRNANAVVDTLIPGRAQARVVTEGLQREATMISELQQLIGFKMNQTKPIPRGWAQIKNSFQDLTNIGQIAMSMGIIGSLEQLTQMPDEQAKQVVGLIAAQAPMLFEATPDKVDVFDGQFLNPMQKDGITKQALDKDPKTRFKAIGLGTSQNKYVPLATELPEAVKPTSPVPGIGQLNSLLGGGTPTPAPTPVPASDYTILEQQLNDAILRHSQDYVQ